LRDIYSGKLPRLGTIVLIPSRHRWGPREQRSNKLMRKYLTNKSNRRQLYHSRNSAAKPLEISKDSKKGE